MVLTLDGFDQAEMSALRAIWTEENPTMADYFITEPGNDWAYTYCETLETAQAKLTALREENPQRFNVAELVETDAFIAAKEQRYLDKPVEEITAERFDEMLNILPPLAWKHEAGVERFNMSEFTSGRITHQFARIGDRYFSKYVRHGDASTYITAAAAA